VSEWHSAAELNVRTFHAHHALYVPCSPCTVCSMLTMHCTFHAHHALYVPCSGGTAADQTECFSEHFTFTLNIVTCVL